MKSSELNLRLDSVFRDVVGSPSYWYKQRGKLEAMTMAVGPASLFVTISNADYDSDHLRKYLCSLPSRLDGSFLQFDSLCKEIDFQIFRSSPCRT